MRKFIALCLILCFALLPAGALGESMLVATFLDAGPGSAILLQCDGEAMLIDSGPRSASGTLLSRLLSLGITSLSHAVITHPHADHIGGLCGLLPSYDVGTLWLPDTDYAEDSSCHQYVALLAARKDLPFTTPEPATSFDLGGATITLLSATEVGVEDPHNACLVIRVDHGGKSLLIIGDLGEGAEAELIASEALSHADGLYLGNHYLRSPDALLDAVTPEFLLLSAPSSPSEAGGYTTLRLDLDAPLSLVSDGTYLRLQGIRTN